MLACKEKQSKMLSYQFVKFCATRIKEVYFLVVILTAADITLMTLLELLVVTMATIVRAAVI